MAERKFKFVSPGIFLKEIDNSALPGAGGDVGPVIVGRSLRGPSMRPVQVKSFSEFVEVFGAPHPGGGGDSSDVWRENMPLGPTYASYAAQAWLRNNTPLTFVRLLGEEHPYKSSGGEAGWKTTKDFATTTPARAATNGGAYGLFLIDSSSLGSNDAKKNWPTGTLAAVWYLERGSVTLTGSVANATTGSVGPSGDATEGAQTTGSVGGFIQCGANTSFTVVLNDGSSNDSYTATAATAVDCIDTTGHLAAHPADASFTILIPTTAGGPGGAAITFLLDASESTSGSGGANQIMIGTDDSISDAARAALIIDAINATTNAKVNFATSGNGQAGYDIGVTAAQGSSDTQITLTMDIVGSQGNLTAALASASGLDIIDVADFTSGESSLNSGSDLVGTKHTFNFSRNSSKFVRRTFSTNPTLTNTTTVASGKQKYYWLGETYEGSVSRYIKSGSAAGSVLGFIAALGNGSDAHQDRQIPAQSAKTGWFISQDLRENYAGFQADKDAYVKKLFRIETLDDGEWAQNHVKISISNIKAPRNNYERYGSFSVEVRNIRDKDGSPEIMEKFTNLNLNPNSENFIAKRIGDLKLTWDNGKKRYKETGDYPNVSKFIRVVLDEDLKNGGLDPEFLPFGVYGPQRYVGFTFRGRDAKVALIGDNIDSDGGSAVPTTLMIDTNQAYIPNKHGLHKVSPSGHDSANSANPIASASIPQNNSAGYTGSIIFPSIPLRTSSISGSLRKLTDAYFGATFNRLEEQTSSDLFDESSLDVVRPLAAAFSKANWDDGATATETSWIFTMDDLKVISPNQVDAQYISGSRAAGTSFTAVSGTYREILTQGYDRFTAALYGGSNGLNVTEPEPFSNGNSVLGAANGTTEKLSYAYHSIKRGVDSVADPEVVEMDLLVAPGITNSSITDHMITVCEDRADAMAVIDLAGDFDTRYESNSSESSRIGTVASAISTFKDRNINSSYAAAFFPWVQARDTSSETFPGKLVWLPPSIAALGTFSSTQRNADLWFAPAGFSRGGLTEGAAGIPITNVRQRLTAEERDDLYEANINPIAKFPAEGIVIFGQKTLQVTPSALDRINVRRLLIYLKKQISRVANRILFEPNVRATWSRFVSQVTPLLETVKARFGLNDFKLVLDETTTTDDLVDRNIMYAKIFLKPTKAIEFIALDFIITNTGASFED